MTSLKIIGYATGFGLLYAFFGFVTFLLGPVGMSISCVAVAVGATVVCDRRVEGLRFCAVASAIFMIPFLTLLALREVPRVAAEAQVTAEFLIENFDSLDEDQDGYLDRNEIWNTISSSQPYSQELVYLNHICSNWNVAGHLVVSEHSVEIEGEGRFAMTEVLISREDLKTYPERFRRKYANWLGSDDHRRD